jgi:RNA polymerase sigma factor (sigma-70 family)
MDPDHELISGCLNRELDSQNKLYQRFAPRMYGVCFRYAGNEMEANDILQNGFLRIFSNLHQYRFNGSLDGWVRRIFIRTALNYCRHNAKYSKEIQEIDFDQHATLSEDAVSILSTKELLAIIQNLPEGMRTVFNLFVIDGYSHEEIGGMLGISEGTSRSQLFHAKSLIKKQLQYLETMRIKAD